MTLSHEVVSVREKVIIIVQNSWFSVSIFKETRMSAASKRLVDDVNRCPTAYFSCIWAPEGEVISRDHCNFPQIESPLAGAYFRIAHH
jgi:hypothetical protein